MKSHPSQQRLGPLDKPPGSLQGMCVLGTQVDETDLLPCRDTARRGFVPRRPFSPPGLSSSLLFSSLDRRWPCLADLLGQGGKRAEAAV